MVVSDRTASGRKAEGAPPAAGDKPRVVELVISGLLRAGVLVSLFVIVAGAGARFVRHPDYVTSKAELGALTRPGASFPRTLPQVAAGVARGEGRAIATAGLLILIATPVLRVAVSAVAFLAERDRAFALISASVLALLLLSFFLGRVEG